MYPSSVQQMSDSWSYYSTYWDLEYHHTWAGNPVFMNTADLVSSTLLRPSKYPYKMDQSCVLPYNVNTFAGLGTYPILSPYLCIPNFGTTFASRQEQSLFHRRGGPSEFGAGQASQRNRRRRRGGLHATLRRSHVAPQRQESVGVNGDGGVRGWHPISTGNAMPWNHQEMPWSAMKSPVDAMKCHKCLEMPWNGWFLILRMRQLIFCRVGLSIFQRAQPRGETLVTSYTWLREVRWSFCCLPGHFQEAGALQVEHGTKQQKERVIFRSLI